MREAGKGEVNRKSSNKEKGRRKGEGNGDGRNGRERARGMEDRARTGV